jgi:hypothetical protein
LTFASIWDDEALRNRIAARVSDYFPDLSKPITIRISKKARRAYSHIYQIEVRSRSHASRQIVVKGSASARREYDELRHLWEEFAVQSSCGVARPLDYFEDGSALVMEAVGGSSLQTLFPRWFWRAADVQSAESACHMAGIWLRLYHSVAATTSFGSLDVAGKLEDFQRTWGDLVGVGFSQRTGEEIFCRLSSSAKAVAAGSFARVRVHGDFSIDNVWFDRDKVVVLDISGVRRSAQELDIAAFLNSLLLVRFGGWIPLRVFRLLRRAFLRGYGYNLQKSSCAIEFFQAIGLVDVLWELWQRRPNRITRGLCQPVLRGLIEILDERNLLKE